MREYNYKILNTKLYLLSILVGCFSGVFATGFRWVLEKLTPIREWMFTHGRPLWFHIVIFIAMWLIALGVLWLTRHIKYIGGSGIPQSRAVIFGRYRFKKPLLQFLGKFIGGTSAIGIGLSLGREGPSVQIGTLGASAISKLFRVNPIEYRYLTSAGAASGLAAAFTAPIASVIFLLEDTLEWVSLRVSLPALIACFISGYCAKLVFAADNIYSGLTPVAPEVSQLTLGFMLLGFAIFGTLSGKLFNFLLFRWQKIYSFINIPVWIKMFAVIVFIYISGMFVLDLTGGGETELIKQIQSNNGSVWILLSFVIIKILLTCLSYATGLCGSLLLPLIVIGGLSGKAYALFLIQSGLAGPECCSYFSLIGMSVIFISVVRAPVSGLMLILEMTSQYVIFFPMIITGALTFLFGQYFNIMPVYRNLYRNMIKSDNVKFRDVEFQINKDSVLDGADLNEIKLPLNCSIIKVSVSENKNVEINNDTNLYKGNFILVRIPDEGYEYLFKTIRTLANE